MFVRVGAAIRLDRVCMSAHGADHFDISPFHRAFRRTRSVPLQLADHIAVACFLRTASRHVRVGGELRDHTQVVSAHITSMLNIASMTPCLYEGIDRYLRLIDATRNSL
jgi:hypothetical protein